MLYPDHFLSALPLVDNLRTRLLAIHLLETVLPACDHTTDVQHIKQVNKVGSSLLIRYTVQLQNRDIDSSSLSFGEAIS